MKKIDLYSGNINDLKLVHVTPVRVRYGETDAMSYVYYGNYAEFFEIGRNECMRALGFPYGRLEDQGIIMPVAEMHIKYRNPAHYDDELDIHSGVFRQGGASMIFGYTITRRPNDETIVFGQTHMAFVERETGKPLRVPEKFSKMLREAFGQQ